MKTIRFDDLNIHDVGTKIKIAGSIYNGLHKTYLVPLPGERIEDSWPIDVVVLKMTADEYERFLNQTDVLDVEGMREGKKIVLRKSHRQISQILAWEVYRRDDFRCRYCYDDGVPLTVDHIDLWEDGGISSKDNLLSACKRCNRIRGSMPYEDWIESESYAGILSLSLPDYVKKVNRDVLRRLPKLRSMRVDVHKEVRTFQPPGAVNL